MASLTVRDIPGDMLDKIKVLSARERRSLNKQFLVIVEDGLKTRTTALERGRDPGPTPSLQVALWRDIAGKWEAARGEILSDADILIAAAALNGGGDLVSGNKAHFARFAGLKVTDWTR